MSSRTLDPSMRILPVLPVKNTALFPELMMPMAVARPLSVSAVESALASEDKLLAVFPQRDANVEDPAPEDLYPIGTMAVIKRLMPIESVMHVVVQGLERIALEEVTETEPHRVARVRILPEPEDWDAETEARHREVVELARRMVEMVQPQMQRNLQYILAEVENPLHQVYLLVSVMSVELEREMELLQAETRREAVEIAHRLLEHELQVVELRMQIASRAQSEMGKDQREYLLRQHMRAIQEELGEHRPEQADVTELRKRLEEAHLPEVPRKEAERELTRLERMPAMAPDYQMTRTWLELVLDLPWRATTEDVFDLDSARAVLDEDHFDLTDVKDRIIEHLAVMKLNPEAKAPILCLVGPPGVGKTSIGQSIARAMGRKFERMSLGGLHDEAELRGHRRTYVGAMPGRIVRAIRRAGVANPLLMLDEVDKMSRDFRGDPASALLEVLDPAQNHQFNDNYLDLPFDLSRVFFICTANTLDSIPGPLLDRLEVLRLAGYTLPEKREIARRYLIPRQLQQAGLKPGQLEISEETLLHVIERYTREAGVRELERVIGRLARKMATRVARGQDEPVQPRPDELLDWLGAEQFHPEQARRELQPGVAAGLAWTQAGGDVLYVETALLPETKDLTLTGQLGKIMQESAQAARSWVWNHADDLGIPRERIRDSGVHVHVPAGAVPKDGPSAGVTMATALASLYADLPQSQDVAMTGEITLSGLVLPVGGIKEKVIAAHRAGIKRVILPELNMKDLRELPDHVRDELEFVPAVHIQDVLAAAIPGLADRMTRRRLDLGGTGAITAPAGVPRARPRE